MKILYVEDNAQDSALTTRALQKHGNFSVEIASTLTSAYERLRSLSGIELVLSDLHLPDGSGLELLVHIRTRHFPVAFVIVTGLGDQDSAVTALKNGADDYVVKRDNYLDHLPQTLYAALSRYRHTAARRQQALRVLYIEHSAFDADLTRRHLSTHAPHIHLEIANDVSEAIALIKSESPGFPAPDLLLLDYRMPGHTGLDAIKNLRDEHHVEQPIILITGQGSERIAVEALRYGVWDYLIKNDNYLELLPSALESAFEQAELRRRESELREYAARLDHLLAANPTILYRLTFANGKIYAPNWVSDNITAILGYTREEAMEEGWWYRHVYADDLKPSLSNVRSLFEKGSTISEYRFYHKNGNLRWIRNEARLLPHKGSGPIEIVSTWNDITPQKEAALQLAEREAKYRLMAENMTDVIWQTTADLIYTYVSPSIKAHRGYTPEQMIGRSILDFVPPHHHARLRELLEQAKQNAAKPTSEREARGAFTVEFEQYRDDGSTLWAETSVTQIYDGEILTGFQGVTRDISARKKLEREMDYLAHYDRLCGLPNRQLFEIRLEHAVDSATRFDNRMALLLIDLDHFKHINDSFGLAAGDALLRSVAECFRQRTAGGDTLARLGGDEFAVLLERLDEREDAGRHAQTLLDELSKDLSLPDGTQVSIGASIGISIFPDHGHTPAELMQQADAAMFHAKAEGRRTFRYFTESLTQSARERLDLEFSLRHAIDRRELQLYYQPVVDVRSGVIVGAEALLRWFREDGRSVPPDRFIPIAEDSGLILPIGEWVLEQACEQLVNWQKAKLPRLFVAVNLSARQFTHPDIAGCVLKILQKTGLDPQQLELEITESALMPQGSDAVMLLDRLKATGVSLSIDDFGTGYSSLAYLQRFPFDTLKIDRRFVSNVAAGGSETIVANSIIQLARALNYWVLAEGVETQEQLEFLRSKGCDLYQGYLFSRPVPASEFSTLLQRHGCSGDHPAIHTRREPAPTPAATKETRVA